MKKTIRIAVVTMLFVMLFSVCAFASDKSEVRAIKKQIKLLESGIKTHNYSKVKKVVKKKHIDFCDFNRIDELVGKDFLKKYSGNSALKAKKISINGNTAKIKLECSLCDCSIMYYEAHKRLVLKQNHNKEYFKKELSEVTNKYKTNGIIRYSVDVTMKKKNGKWVFERDPRGTFFDMYSCGYWYMYTFCSVICWQEW